MEPTTPKYDVTSSLWLGYHEIEVVGGEVKSEEATKFYN